ncbi:MAG: hypothetical protein NTY00_13475 [Deltaproteobacteria bacterium]|nr:hypothetical protein [Deltaproteobacteria bacterium]
MRKFLTPVLVFLLFAFPAMAGDGLDAFLSNVNVQARTDMNGFSAKVSAQFGVPEPQVRVVLRQVNEPADAFMVFQLGQMTNQQPDRVMQVYQSQKGRGWGVIAKELGIKPGSAEFHALKSGDFRFGVDQGEQPNPGKGRGKGKGNGKGNGKGKHND